MEDFKIESRYVKLYYKYWAIIRCIQAAFTDQIFKNSYVFVNQKTVSKHAAEPLEQSAELLKH